MGLGVGVLFIKEGYKVCNRVLINSGCVFYTASEQDKSWWSAGAPWSWVIKKWELKTLLRW